MPSGTGAGVPVGAAPRARRTARMCSQRGWPLRKSAQSRRARRCPPRPGSGEQYRLPHRVEPGPARAPDSLPDSVGRQGDEAAAVELLEVVEHDLTDREVEAHLQGGGGDQAVEFGPAEAGLDRGAPGAVEARVVFDRIFSV